jgi:hypothetical protein
MSSDETIQFKTPTFLGATFSAAYITTQLGSKAQKVHSHTFSDLRGALPNCAAGQAYPICIRGELLVVGAQEYAPLAKDSAGNVVRNAQFSDLKLAATASRWNDIGTFDDTINTLLAVSASVQAGGGLFLPTNMSEDLKIRVTSGKIQEWHVSPTLGGRSVFVDIKYHVAK